MEGEIEGFRMTAEVTSPTAAGRISKGMFGMWKIGRYSLPDDLFARKFDAAMQKAFNTSLDQIYAGVAYLKDYSYHLIEIPFGFSSNDWKHIENVSLDTEFVLGGMAHISDIYPGDLSAPAGTVVKEYQVHGNFSISTSATGGVTLAPSMGGLQINSNIDARFGISQKIVKSVKYDLTVPKITAYHNGNKEAGWKFMQNEMFGANAGYKVVVIFGIPRSQSISAFIAKLTLTVAIKFWPNPKPVLRECPVHISKEQ